MSKNYTTATKGDKTNVDVSMLESGDTIILIVGMTGVGKSTFIDKAVGSFATTINDDVNFSGSQTVQPVISSHPNDSTRRLVFLDTPGFDAWDSDTQAWGTIPAWLQAASFEKEATLGGIIYLYDISQTRRPPINRSLAMFYRPNGEKEVKNVVLATTKCTQSTKDNHKRSEELLCSDDKLWTEIIRLLLKEGPQLDNTQFRSASDALAQSVALQKRVKSNRWRTLFILHKNSAFIELFSTKMAGRPKLRKSWKRKDVKEIDNLVPVPGAKDTDVIIPIMGPTGVGKSTFINVAAGNEVTRVGDDLESCTSTILPVIVPFPNDPERRIIFVDTPGFDDTYLDDTEILRRIAVWMAFAYNENMKLAGIIYLHEISQARMLGTSRKNFVMFNRLSGLKAVKSVVLATTKWNDIPADVGNKREYQLSTTHWHNMLQQGSRMCRFTNTQESAWEIVTLILGTGEIEALLIQEELVDLQKRIPMTEAGAAIRNGLQELLKEQKELARSLKKESEENEDLRERYQEVERQLRSTIEQIKDLKVPLGRRIMDVFVP